MDMQVLWISYSLIMGLPWIVKGPGLLIIGLFIYRFTKNIMQFSVFSSFAALFWIVFTGYLMIRFGDRFAGFLYHLV